MVGIATMAVLGLVTGVGVFGLTVLSIVDIIRFYAQF